MSTPKAGKRIRLRKAIPSLPHLAVDVSYVVHSVSKWTGEKKRVYFHVPGRAELECLWSSQVAALSRCTVCDSENHKTPKMGKDGYPMPCLMEMESAA